MVDPGGSVGFKFPANIIVDTKDKQIRTVKVFMMIPFQKKLDGYDLIDRARSARIVIESWSLIRPERSTGFCFFPLIALTIALQQRL